MKIWIIFAAKQRNVENLKFLLFSIIINGQFFDFFKWGK